MNGYPGLKVYAVDDYQKNISAIAHPLVEGESWCLSSEAYACWGRVQDSDIGVKWLPIFNTRGIDGYFE